jgi:exopolyphosphatase/guanosine-5'-triphosphate,3'-diphosphate pyrophosphatase
MPDKEKQNKKKRKKNEALPSSPIQAAVIDLGAFSVRLHVFEIDTNNNTHQVLEELALPLPLGEDVFRTGRIGNANMLLAEKIFNDFAQVMREYNVTQYRAMATSAVRESDNQVLFLDRIAQSSGIKIEVMEGPLESRLIFLSVQEKLKGQYRLDKGNSVIYTIGSGSSQVCFIEDGHIVSTDTIRIGALRVMQDLRSDLTEESLREAIDPFAAAIFNGIKRMTANTHPDSLITVGASVRALLELESGAAPKVAAHISRKRFDTLSQKVQEHSISELVNDYGLADQEARAMIPCCHIVEQLFEISEANRMIVPMVNTRDALAMDLCRELMGQEDPFIPQILSAARHLGAKFQHDESHAESVYKHACTLFDKLQDLHRLSPRDKLLLQIAAILHDIGFYISNKQHHKHSYYLISNSEIPGITETELRLVALIARYHRRTVPKSRHVEYTSLSRSDRVRLYKLAAILRVADALDRSHLGKVKEIQVQIEERRILLSARGASELSLEQWAMDRKADMFEEAFCKRVIVAT